MRNFSIKRKFYKSLDLIIIRGDLMAVKMMFLNDISFYELSKHLNINSRVVINKEGMI